MTAHRRNQRGIALAYVAIFFVMLALMVGLATDLGRAYAVRHELAKAVDAAALAAARVIPNGQTAAQNEANQIFRLNFPDGHLGVESVTSPSIEFDNVPSGPNVGAHLITVSATATLPTTFMRISGNDSIDIPVAGQSTRRLVDLAFVVDHSGSLSAVYSQVKDAANRFVDFFDSANDRMTLVFFARDTVVADEIVFSGRGFNKTNIKGHITQSQSGGQTSTAEGLYRGWDQLRRVPPDIQSGLRVVVLFTDGAPNTFSSGFRVRQNNTTSSFISNPYRTSGGSCPGSVPNNAERWCGGLHVDDYPSTTSTPNTTGLFPILNSCCGTLSGQPSCSSPFGSSCWDSGDNFSPNYTNAPMTGIPLLPTDSVHSGAMSAGMSAGFPLYTGSLSGQRVLLAATTGTTLLGYPYPSHARNVGNAARNLAERIAYEIRTDATGAHPIHIYALGLGAQLNTNDGVPAETGSSILRRIANDPASGSFDPNQPEGKYYFAGDATQLNEAFQQIRDQIIRISE